MALEGLHHITAITGDAPRNVDFYARALGLRLVKKTVNFDQPDVYHLYYGDELATPGAILTFFEFPGAAPGRHGDGMPYRIAWRVAGDAALDFWSARLDDEGVAFTRAADGSVRFADPEGLEHELVVDDVARRAARRGRRRRPRRARAAGVRRRARVRVAPPPARARRCSSALGLRPAPSAIVGAGRRAAPRALDATTRRRAAGRRAPARSTTSRGRPPTTPSSTRFREIAAAAGARPTPIIDRQYFHSVYFREPSGVLFELASRDVGFDVDEPLESLGEALMLPPQYEARREQLQARLTPITNPRQRA